MQSKVVGQPKDDNTPEKKKTRAPPKPKATDNSEEKTQAAPKSEGTIEKKKKATPKKKSSKPLTDEEMINMTGEKALEVLRKWGNEGRFKTAATSDINSPQVLYAPLLQVFPQNPIFPLSVKINGMLAASFIAGIWHTLFTTTGELSLTTTNTPAHQLELWHESLNSLKEYDFDIRILRLALYHLMMKRQQFAQDSLANVGDLRENWGHAKVLEKELAEI